MDNQYINYKYNDFLQDDFFLQSYFNPTPETRLFWERLRKNKLIKDKEYQKALSIIQSFKIINQLISPSEQSVLWEKICQTNTLWKKKKRRLFFMKVAACILLLIMPVAYLYLKEGPSDGENISLIARKIKPANEIDQIQLFLTHREKIDVNKQNSSIEYIPDGTVKVNSRIIDTKQEPVSQTEEMRYNQLIVPKGKRSTLVLCDGTKLWVNAGTRVVYPRQFPSGKREIYVDGEVYIDVTPNKDRPFYVRTDHLNIKVLGTSFNVMAYEQDLTHQVVLVRGSVLINMDNKESEKLIPNKMLSYTNGRKEVKEVNVEDYILWKEGLYNYHSEKLGIILDRLSRYYGKEIDYEPGVALLKCSGKLDMLEDLEIVLDGLSKTVPIQVNKKNDAFEIIYIK